MIQSASAKLARSGPTHPKQFRASQHAFLQTCIEEIHVVSQELVDSLDFACFELTLKLPPIRLEDLERRERKDLLDKREHSGTKQEHALAPVLKLRMPIFLRRRLGGLATSVQTGAFRTSGTAPGRRLVLYPHRRQ